MSADETRDEELAARALSHLTDPPIPEGLAARIAARAAATPQVGGDARDSGLDAALAARSGATGVTRIRDDRKAPDRRRRYVPASIAALLLLSIGLYVGLDQGGGDDPVIASEEPAPMAPEVDVPASARLADAAPEAKRPAPARAQQPQRRAETAMPAMVLPVPATPPVELAADQPPAVAPALTETPLETEKLARTGPENLPSGGARPVYGPTAPSGLGIAGPPNGGISLPTDSHSGGRGPGLGLPPSGPPSGMPGPGGPRGPGPGFSS